LRLDDAARLMAFASQHDLKWQLLRKRGDLALALGRPHDALLAYRKAESGDAGPEVQRRIARAEALLGQTEDAIARAAALAERPDPDSSSAYAATLDLARLGGLPPPEPVRPTSPTHRPTHHKNAGAGASWREAAREAIRSLCWPANPPRAWPSSLRPQRSPVSPGSTSPDSMPSRQKRPQR